MEKNQDISDSSSSYTIRDSVNRSIKNLSIFANSSKSKKSKLNRPKKSNLTNSKKLDLAKAQKSDFAKANFFGTDFLTPKVKKAFI